MAFKAEYLGIHVSSTGKGGFLTYFSPASGQPDSHTADQIAADTFWQGTITNRTDLAARTAAEAFVKQQSPDPSNTSANTGGVPILILGNNTTGTNRQYWTRARIVPSGANAGRLVITPRAAV